MAKAGTIYAATVEAEWVSEKATAQLRWVVPAPHAPEAKRLQQLWVIEGPRSVKHKWRYVPIVVLDPAEKDT